ncbi:MAG: AAC(3) family N-acetyltransferase [Smithella sp.]|jgi:aminoglycoside 3-N-acetyltransferase
MRKMELFRTKKGIWITNQDLLRTLEKVDAHKCQILCMHSELSFGIPNPALRREELLRAVYETIQELNVQTICVPTFTFSFCNGESYDILNSRSKMGVLNEYIRKLPAAKRSRDPLMSFAIIGRDTDLVDGVGHFSVGTRSTFDLIHHKKDVKFLFFGARLYECFTYTHYVEEKEAVPYRYNRNFTGTIINGNDKHEDTYTLFVRYRNVIPTSEDKFERYLLTHNLMKKEICGDTTISSIDELTAYEAISSRIKEDIDYLLAQPYPRNGLDKSFAVKNMVAL